MKIAELKETQASFTKTIAQLNDSINATPRSWELYEVLINSRENLTRALSLVNTRLMSIDKVFAAVTKETAAEYEASNEKYLFTMDYLIERGIENIDAIDALENHFDEMNINKEGK